MQKFHQEYLISHYRYVVCNENVQDAADIITAIIKNHM